MFILTPRTAQNETMLLLAIRHQLEPVADRLCDLGAEVGVADSSGNSPLWVALRSRQKSIAAKLVRKEIQCSKSSFTMYFMLSVIV